MTIRLNELRDVKPVVSKALARDGFENLNKLLRVAAEPQARREVAMKLGVSESEVLRLVNRADLARIDGIGGIYADLLELAGVNTVAELRTCEFRSLHARIKAVAKQHHVRRTPNPATVEDWIEQAQMLNQLVF